MNDEVITMLRAASWIYIGSVVILTAAACALAIAAGYWATRFAGWAAGRIRHRFDKARMASLPELPRTANGQAVDDYWTIRRAWNLPNREEARR